MTAYIVTGLALTIFALIKHPVDFRSLEEAVSETKVVDIYSDHTITPPSGHWGSVDHAEIYWSIQLEYPKRIEKGSSFLVSALPKIIKITTIGRAEREMSMTDFLRRRGVIPDIKLVLNLSNAKVQPDILGPVTLKEKNAWSVFIPTSGYHNGVVTINEAEKEIGKRNYTKFRLDSEPKIRIEVFEPLFSVPNMFSLLAMILGPLITIPGMVAFWRQLKNGNAKDEDEVSKIIQP